MKKNSQLLHIFVLLALLFGAASPSGRSVAAPDISSNIVISQVYGGGGSSSASTPYINDFIELYNLGPDPVDVTGWTVQYGSAAGTSWTGMTVLSGTILPGHYYLVQEAGGGAFGAPLPTPDATGTLPMSNSSGKVALTNSNTIITGACLADPTIVDFVGYGSSANCFETSRTASLNNTTAAIRKNGGAQDTDNNANDFEVGAPNPRNSTWTPPNPAPTVTGVTPADGATGVPADTTITVTFSEDVTVTDPWFTLTCNSVSQPATYSSAQPAFTITPDADLPAGASCTVTIEADNVVDQATTPAHLGADYQWGFTVFAPTVPAPFVQSTNPEDAAADVPVDANLTIEFDKPVSVTGAWYNIFCDVSFDHTATVSGGPQTWTLNPDTDFTPGEACTILIEADYVVDQASPTTHLEADYSWGFVVFSSNDPAPYVQTTSPADGAVDVARDAGVSITFSEPVTVETGWYEFSCNGVAKPVTLSGASPTFTLTPETPYNSGETCTVTIYGVLVTDQDTDDPFDSMLADYQMSFTTVYDPAPTVQSVTPANAGTGVAVDANLSVTFSENVDAGSGWFAISCGNNVVHTAVVSGGPLTYTLNPDTNFGYQEVCTVTLESGAITDQDSDDPYNNMAADYTWSFTTELDITPIHDIQLNGATSLPGTFTVEAIVVGDYQTQGSGQLRGFFLQEEDADVDADPATSEGIFVFCSNCPVAVAVGDKVRVTGDSSEFNGLSELTASTVDSVTVLSSGTPLPTPAALDLPVPGVPTGDLAAATAFINAYYEAVESMLVTFPDTLSVSEYFELARYGQVILSEGGRPHTFTDANTPTAAGYINNQIELASRKVILDDTDNVQNRPVTGTNTPYYYPVPGLSTGNFFRGGDTITNLTGVLQWYNGWRIRPVTEAYTYSFTPANLRPALPVVGGRLKVTGYNVLNYFLTIDTTSSSSSGACGPNGTQDCRGADSVQELERQRAKLLAALQGLNADVVGLMELENTTGVEPLADIVAGLTGYAYINTGTIGGDAIKVGIIYKTATVQPVGSYAILNSSVDSRFNDSRNRPSLAQTFKEVATGARFTVVVNHLKSKGSGCGAGDDDTTTGQGNCNATRTQAALALADWLLTDPTSSGDPDFLVIGDMNSYAKEDPIVALENAGFTNLVSAFGGPDAYSYVFDGQLGYLDHALANASLFSQVAGAAEWHINADEIPLFDYNDDVFDTGEASFDEESDVTSLYSPDQYRTSDHDPVLIGLNLDAPAIMLPDSLQATKIDGVMQVTWSTVNETILSGFNVYRSTDPLVQGEKLNAVFIDPQHAGQDTGANYLYEDPTAQPGIAYYYWIEVVTPGGTLWVGPAAAPVDLLIFMPIMLQ